MLLTNLTNETNKLKVVLSLVIFIFISMNYNPVMSQDTEIIKELKEQYENSPPEQKAVLLKSISDEYDGINQQLQMKYAQKIIDLPDSLVDIELKSQMFELLNSFYKSKLLEKNEGEKLNKNSNEIDGFAIGFFVFSLIMIIAGIAAYLLSLRKYNLKITELEDNAEKVYNEKYEKLNKVESKLNKELEPLRKELKKFENEEIVLKKKLKGLEEANYLKNAFLSNMSHEIRNSLNGISGFANILETELALMADDNLYSYAQKIQQSGDKLENLLTNIIDISMIEANIVEKEVKENNINEIISFVENANSFRANEKGIVFKTKTDTAAPSIMADNEKLKKVLNVLVGNALKFTRKGFVTITSSHEEESEKTKIEIKDTGDGIQKDYAQLISNAFSSNNDVQEKSYQGIGIGLKLCKKFIELMDGSIEMKTNEGKGTIFTIYLPTATSKAKTLEEVESKNRRVTLINIPELGSLDIFIVEDDRMNRMVLEKMLKKSGSITTAVDGDDALKLIKKAQKRNTFYSVMLFDINLPAPWDGTRLMQEIRRIYPEYKNIPFIAQTAYAMAGDKSRFLEAGFDDYISKPIIKNELLTLIEKQIIKFTQK